YPNTIAAGAVTSNSGSNAAPATDSLTVLSAIGLTKAFSPSPVLVGTTSHLTLTLTNSSTVAASGLSLTDTYPSGLSNASAAVTTCPGGSAIAIVGGGTLQLSGATLASGASCTVETDVASPTAGSFPNTVQAGDVASSLGTNNASNPATSIFAAAANLGV